MLRFAAILTPPLLLAGCATMQGEPRQTARAMLMDAQGRAVGEVLVTGIDTGIRVKVTATGMTPGVHGVHIHTVGRCDAPAFASAGGHWNPGNNHHGLRTPDGPHRGDLPNLRVNARGHGTLTANIAGGVISGDPGALLDSDGSAFLIHADPDDMLTDPSGNSGNRVACGVFTPIS